MFLREIRLQGSTLLTNAEIERAVYPHLGPGRSAEDVERARAALQQLYHDKGYQTVSVQIPQQKVRRGVVVLQASEVAVGKLRVRGSQYHDLETIRRGVPSLAEGTVPNFNQVFEDVVALNQVPGQQVSPELLPGAEPGTLDVELNVEDSLPLHGSLELNNRNSANTTALRLNGSMRYDNLWQAGNGIGASFQVSPSDINEVQVFSGYYLARFSGLEKLTLTLSGMWQNSNIGTLGNAVSVGKGYTIGARANYALPMAKNYFQSISLGVDYRHSTQEIRTLGGSDTVAIDYVPFTLGYSGTWMGETQTLSLYLGYTMHFRGMGSGTDEWAMNRYNADGGFSILRMDIGYTAELAENLEGYLRLHGQLTDRPLVNSEQSAGGGLDSVRGYYEGEVVDDQSLMGTFELRTDILNGLARELTDSSAYASTYLFADGGLFKRKDPLLGFGEKSSQYLASFGVGARFGFFEYLSGSINLGIPVIDGPSTRAWHPRATFVIRGDF